METIKIEGNKRSEVGTKFSKEERISGVVPCVIYGESGVQHFTVTPKSVKGLLYTPDFKIVDLSIDGSSMKAIVKASQFHPVTDKLLHLDFLELTEGKSVKVDIPLRPKGVSKGVKLGGKLIQQVRTVKVKLKPEDIVAELFVDITNLELGQAARIKDIEITDKLEIMNPPATPVIAVEIPRALRSATTAAEKDEEGSAVAPAAE